MEYETNKNITQEELDKMGEELSNYAELYINQQFKKISNDMNYEQKYKEANDKVAARFGTNVAKEIFTDLYESEDEKVRRCIGICLLADANEQRFKDCGTTIKDCLAWLEKQGEKVWSEETDDDAWMNDIISKVENNLQLNKAEIDWLKSLKQRIGGKL